MISFRSFAASAGLLIAGSAAISGVVSADDPTSAPQQIIAPQPQGNAQMLVNSRITSGYKKTSWEKYQSLASGGSQAAAAGSDVPPTDCPPAPTQVCLDSWKPKLINPFPEKDTKTINPFE